MALKKGSTIYEPRPVVVCAHMGCTVPALVRVKTETGWANFCEDHYVQHWSAVRWLRSPERSGAYAKRIRQKPHPSESLAVKEVREAYAKRRKRSLREAHQQQVSEACSQSIREAELTQSVREPGQDEEEKVVA